MLVCYGSISVGLGKRHLLQCEHILWPSTTSQNWGSCFQTPPFTTHQRQIWGAGILGGRSPSGRVPRELAFSSSKVAIGSSRMMPCSSTKGARAAVTGSCDLLDCFDTSSTYHKLYASDFGFHNLYFFPSSSSSGGLLQLPILLRGLWRLWLPWGWRRAVLLEPSNALFFLYPFDIFDQDFPPPVQTWKRVA